MENQEFEIMQNDYPKDFAEDDEFTAELLDDCEKTEKKNVMKTYLLYVRQYSIITNDYALKVYKVTTDSVYRIIGKMYCNAFEDIKRIDYNKCTEKRKNFWKEKGYTIHNYIEPKLNED